MQYLNFLNGAKSFHAVMPDLIRHPESLNKPGFRHPALSQPLGARTLSPRWISGRAFAGMTVILPALAAFCLLFAASDAHAMHISEGILPLPWAALWFGLCIPFIGYGLHRVRKMGENDLSVKPLIGLMAAAVFIISCMPVPVPTAGTCSHPAGTGISGILLGPGPSAVVAAAALLIQALFLSHGGLSTFGANVLSMGVVGSLAGFLTFRTLRLAGIRMAAAAFMAGLFADWATYLTTSIQLASGIRGDSAFLPLFWKILLAFLPTQLPVGVLEGALTSGVVVLLYRKRPDLLVKMRVLRQGEA